VAEVKITYETLFDLLRRERNREELQSLDSTFYTDVISYMAQKQALLTTVQAPQHDYSSETEKARIQFHNIKKILKELYDRREKKLVLLALNAVRTSMSGIDKSAFLPEEHLFFNDLTKHFSHYRIEVLSHVMQQTAPFGGVPAPVPKQTPPKAAEKPPETPKPAPAKDVPVREERPPAASTEGIKLRFTKAVPRFAGGGEDVFGPFVPGDEASLPEKIASVLVKKGRAEQL
jgi:DNA replication initiation complex subunit (GINS family)